MLGPYDFVNIVEVPSNEAISKVSIELGSRGTVQITSMPATSIDNFISMIKSANMLKRIRKFHDPHVTHFFVTNDVLQHIIKGQISALIFRQFSEAPRKS